jgi:hypothetical protein
MMLGLIGFIAPVSIASILAEMGDLERLATVGDYRSMQQSSYDRASKSPAENWFANADAGHFIRVEEREGRKEHVMAEMEGPGAIVRIWSANPAGVLRVYVNGESKPRLEAPMGDLLRGRVAPFASPFAYEVARGCNLYFPIPYAKSCKVTVDDTGQIKGLYYHVGYRQYPVGTAVETFHLNDIPDLKATSSAMRNPPSPGTQLTRIQQTVTKAQGLRVGVNGPGVIREFRLKIPPLGDERRWTWDDPRRIHNVLRGLKLRVTVDGETTILTPVGDFFATAGGVHPAESLPLSVGSDGTLLCRFVMPFERRIDFDITNSLDTSVPVNIQLSGTRNGSVPPLRLYAGWGVDHGSTRPMRDLEFLKTTGQGRLVGSFLHVENPTPGWWGEGDEKIYVDGEAFPSFFGTGTEDYYGYAWCSPELFRHPYHGQPNCTGPANFGHTNVFRWHIVDDIPFNSSIRFDMEMWHWETVVGTWARTTYWYARPGDPGPADFTLRLPAELLPPKPIEGAIEGETMTVERASGGTHTVQDGFWALSGGKQRWWQDAKPGDELILRFEAPKAGTFRIVANLCYARDYGKHEIWLDGQRLGEWDFYSPDLGWKKVDLGKATLTAGSHRLRIICREPNPKAEPRRMFGLDYVLLEP